MRPKVLTVKNFLLLAAAVAIFAGLVSWLRGGGKLPWAGVPPTAGKIAFVSTRGGGSGDADIYVMDGADGANVTPLAADDKADDREPAWSGDGGEVVFTADRQGVVRQVYQTRVEPNARLLQRTSTSGTKETPRFYGSREIYFLDAGKIARIASDASDASAIFPTVELVKDKLGNLFQNGGITDFAVSPDGEKIAAVLKVEGGEALLVYFPGSKDLVALGVARRVQAGFARDNSLVAAFAGGLEQYAPRPEPLGLLLPSQMPPEQYAVYRVPRLVGGLLISAESGDNPDAGLMLLPPEEGGVNRVVRFDSDLKPVAGVPLPFEPEGFAVAPGGDQVAVTGGETSGEFAGLYVVPLSEGGQGGKLYEKAAEQPSFSPDGTKIAFASGGDIYTVPTAGGEPVNLTKGEGTNSRPVWSPQEPKAK